MPSAGRAALPVTASSDFVFGPCNLSSTPKRSVRITQAVLLFRGHSSKNETPLERSFQVAPARNISEWFSVYFLLYRRDGREHKGTQVVHSKTSSSNSSAQLVAIAYGSCYLELQSSLQSYPVESRIHEWFWD